MPFIKMTCFIYWNLYQHTHVRVESAREPQRDSDIFAGLHCGCLLGLSVEKIAHGCVYVFGKMLSLTHT